ncbi:hypothetical protein CCACVL1_27962 [Corchorus capsularis]|uniref:Uncharacterized protein n=1 Tax=Corchorus capsularis TaxID=210143 RepID=A0A1R3G847_COCAP|nr:hypothetical protein CCACVL1_27962 [Corchorus capsularis]
MATTHMLEKSLTLRLHLTNAALADEIRWHRKLGLILLEPLG